MPPPLDAYITSAANNPLVIDCLTPLPRPAEVVWAPAKGKGKDNKGGKNGKGKGKSKDSSQAPQNVSLKELLDNMPQGCVRANDENRFLCPFFNKRDLQVPEA